MKKSARAIVLRTTIQGQTRYVATIISKREYDNSKVVDHTPDEDKAMQFDSVKDASTFLASMVNPHGRTYTVDKIVMPEARIYAGNSRRFMEASADSLR